MEFNDVFFNFPARFIWILLALAIFWLTRSLSRYRQSQLKLFGENGAFSKLLFNPRSSERDMTKSIGWVLVWILLCLTLMEPAGNERFIPKDKLQSKPEFSSQNSAQEIALLIDSSASMLVEDGKNAISRLNEAKSIAESIVQSLNGQMGSLYAFSSELIPLVPPTIDYVFLRLAVNDLQINEGDITGTSFQPVLKALSQEDFLSFSPKYTSIIFFSDGGDTQLENLQANVRQSVENKILQSFNPPVGAKITIYTVGIGQSTPKLIPGVTSNNKPVFSSLQPTLLKNLAEKNGGKYYLANEWNDWDLADAIMKQINESRQAASQYLNSQRSVESVSSKDRQYDLYFQIPLFLLLIIYIFNLLLPNTKNTALTLLLLALPSFVPGGEEIIRIDRAAQDYYDANGLMEATDLYTPLIEQQLPEWQKSRLLYNLATIDLKSGRTTEALSSYQQIQPLQLDLPIYGKRLFYNQSIALIIEANKLKQDTDYLFADLQNWLLELAFKSLEKSIEITCSETTETNICEQASVIKLKELIRLKQNELADGVKESKLKLTALIGDGNTTAAQRLRQGIELQQQFLRQSLNGLKLESDTESRKKLMADLSLLQTQINHSFDPFFQSVIAMQSENYQNQHPSLTTCLQFPWNEIISLYIRGQQAASQTENELKAKNPSTENIIERIAQSTSYWQKALNLLLNPLSSSAQNTNEQPPLESDIKENIRQLQEMYAEDQVKPARPKGEMHAW